MADWLEPYVPLSICEAASACIPELEWVGSREESDEHMQVLAETYSGNWNLGVLWIGSLWELCGQELQHCHLVARIIRRTLQNPQNPALRGLRVELEADFYTDERRPNRLLFAPNDRIPPALWVEIGLSPEDMVQVL
jgi:hypothetical protein